MKNPDKTEKCEYCGNYFKPRGIKKHILYRKLFEKDVLEFRREHHIAFDKNEFKHILK